MHLLSGVLGQVDPESEMSNFFEQNTFGQKVGLVMLFAGIVLVCFLVVKFALSAFRHQVRWLSLIGAVLLLPLLWNLPMVGQALSVSNDLVDAAIQGFDEFISSR